MRRAAAADDAARIVLRDGSPLVLAETCLIEIGLDKAGRQTIARWAGQWWRWSDGHHRAVDDETRGRELWRVLRRVAIQTTDGKGESKCKPLYVHSRTVSEVADAMTAVADRVAATADIPCALPGYEGPAPGRVAIVRNGRIDLDTGLLHPPTPRLFATAGAAVDYDPAATCPTWERFLGEIFADEDCGDDEAIRLLRQIFGWMVSATRRATRSRSSSGRRARARAQR